MEITNLVTQNIHGNKYANINPAKLNFITGPSGSGKSSLMEAIRYAITGKTGSDHITTGASMASISMTVPKIGLIERSVTDDGKTKVRLNRKTTTAKSIVEQYAAIYGFNLNDVSLLFSSDVLKHALGKDLAEYLLNGGFISNDMTYARLLALNPLEPEIADELERTLFSAEDCASLPRNARKVTLDSIETAYQQFRASRPPLKKMYAEEAAQGKLDGEPPTKPASKVQDEINALQVKIAVERKKAADYPRALKESENLKIALGKAESDLAAYAFARPVTMKERETANANKQNATKLVDETRLALQTAKQDAKNLQKTLDMLATSRCPISNALVCTTDKTSVRSELEDAIQLKLDSADTLETRLETYMKSLEDARRICDDIVKQEGAYKMRLNLEQQVERLREAKITIPEKPDPTILAKLEEELNQLRATHTTAMQYESAAKHAERAKALARRLEIAETLVKELAPNGGVRKQVLAHSIGPMEDVCNESMKIALPKYKLHFDTDNNFNIVLEDSTGNRIAFDSISNGEQLRVAFVLMLMLNQVNQVRILLLDNLNDLDVAAFQDFLKMLEAVDPTYYDHIFLSGIDHEGFVDAFNKCAIPHMVIRCVAPTK